MAKDPRRIRHELEKDYLVNPPSLYPTHVSDPMYGIDGRWKGGTSVPLSKPQMSVYRWSWGSISSGWILCRRGGHI